MAPKPGESLKLLFAALGTNLLEAAFFLWLTNDYHSEWLGTLYMRIAAVIGSIVIFFLVYLPILANNPKRSWLICFGVMIPLNTIYLVLLGKL